MKVLYVFLLLCILSIYAQRRLTKHDSSDLEPTPQKTIRSRGRTRFSITPEFENVSEDYELVKKVQNQEGPRRQPERKPHKVAQDAIFSRRSYEVREIVDDIPRENPPRLKKKPHVVTEMKFEAANAPPKEIITPTPLPETDVPVSKPAESVAEKSTETSVEHTSAAPIPDLKRKSTEAPDVRRFHSRGRQLPPKTEEPPASRSRSKHVQKQPGTHTTAATTPHRSTYRVQRRRLEPTAETAHDSLRTKGPSVFSAEPAHEFPSRARTGRKVVTQSGEDVTENTVVLRRRPSRRSKTLDSVTVAPKPETSSQQNVIEQDASPPERKVESRRSRVSTSTEASTTTRSARRGVTRVHQDVEATTIRQRTRTRAKSESVVTTPTRAVYSRRRQPTSIDDIDAASTKQTEVKVKVFPPPDFEPTNVRVSLQRTISEETQPGRIVRKRLHHVRKSPTKANEIVEQTPSVDTFDAPRKFDLLNLRQNEERGPRPSQQTTRKTTRSKQQTVEKASSSQDSVDESDNYPAAFKAAIIQAKKKKHGLLGSRTLTANEASVTKTAETTTVTSSISSTSSRSSFPYPDAVTSAALKKDEETSTIRASRYPPRPRFSLTTKQPKIPEKEREVRKYNSYKSKYPNPAVENEQSPTTQKYHARYHAKIQNDIDVPVPPRPPIKTRNYIPKPPKGIFSSRRSATEEKPIKIEISSLSTKVPPVGLSARNRFSARYRNEILPKSIAHRQATNVPSYTPTVPTVTPPSSTDHYWPEEDMTDYQWSSNRIN
uniref:Uncharacterized protein n=2 Tax=Photinus pyralis TaxID=7054 RepID=A0A1Y1N250_PHOPY